MGEFLSQQPSPSWKAFSDLPNDTLAVLTRTQLLTTPTPHLTHERFIMSTVSLPPSPPAPSLPFIFETGPQVAQAGFRFALAENDQELLTLLLPSLKCGNSRHALPHPVHGVLGMGPRKPCKLLTSTLSVEPHLRSWFRSSNYLSLLQFHLSPPLRPCPAHS